MKEEGSLEQEATLALAEKSDRDPLPVGPLLHAKSVDPWLGLISKARARVLGSPSL